MAIISQSSNNWILSLKVLLFSVGVLSMAVILKLSVPVIFAFAVSEVPLLWSSLLSWLRPPYLYVVINGIIITIAASSRFQQKVDEQESVLPMKIPSDVQPDYAVSSEFGFDAVVMRKPVDFMILESSEVCGSSKVRVSEVKTMMNASEGNDEEDFVISRSTWTPQRNNHLEIPSEYSLATEKPLVSVRFGHRKTVKASPEGTSLSLSPRKFGKGFGGVEAETAGHAGEHMEDNNGRETNAVGKASEEIGHVGDTWSSPRRRRRAISGEDEEIRNVQGPKQQPSFVSVAVAVAGIGKA
ncbi:hypothetical protein HHK36_001964 [Tetracentron sinense]|uniref:DUF4408 domain-containing protein n=1 Tax=Tetracentron sinense TaxID=13715 RepID=A0A834ZX21_TETSI|nr:hypothetical protein HHK36_001964 [Tetracentron sinense]